MKSNFFSRFFIAFVLIATAAGLAAYLSSDKVSQQNVSPTPAPSPTPTPVTKATKALINVPFISQAPLADWADPRHQDGCEEASILMAWLWVNGKTMTKEDAEVEIEKISDFELEQYGNFHDTDAYDTVKVMKDYYGYDRAEVVINPSLDEIKDQLRAGKIVLVPANGQRLDNPNYKAPGPYTHMVVIKGFDDSKNHFITNDPGTRLGESFKFTYSNLFNAMVNYPTGEHLPQEGRPKAMIIISK